MRLYFLILAPIFLGLAMYVKPPKRLSKATLFIQLAMIWLSISNFFSIKSSGYPITVDLGSRGLLGIKLSSELISSVFIILITSLFFVFSIYIYDNLLENNMFLFLFFSAESMILLTFLSEDLFNIFIALEISSILCSLMITLKKEKRSMYDGLIFLMTNTVGALFFLLGVAMLYKTFGVLDMEYIENLIPSTGPRAVIIPYSLMMTGLAVKCTLLPIFSFLPKANGTSIAPPVISAILSGVYLTSELYIYVRMKELFSPVINMDSFFIVIGLLTAVVGMVFALLQKDIKLMLSYSTISQVGLIVVALSIDDSYTKAGGLLHIMNHALFKSLLFMAAGMIEYEYKTRNVDEIRGVFRRLPITGLSMIIGILGITGAPLMNGSLSKYFIQSGIRGIWIESLIVLINFGTMLYFIKFGSMLLKKPVCNFTAPEKNHRVLAMGILGSACLVTGLGASFISEYFLGIDVTVNMGSYLEKIAFWIVLIAMSVAAYSLFIHKRKLSVSPPALDMSFNGIAMSIVFFFFLILGFSYLA